MLTVGSCFKKQHFGTYLLIWLFSFTAEAWSEPITSIAQILALDARSVADEPKFEIEATVCSNIKDWNTLFLEQDGQFFLCSGSPAEVSCGTLVRVVGTVKAGTLKNFGLLESLDVIGTKALPKPVQIRFDDLAYGDHDCEWVTFKARVNAVQVGSERSYLYCAQGDTNFVVSCSSTISNDAAVALVDAEIEVKGNLFCDPDKNGEINRFDVFGDFENIRKVRAAEDPLDIASPRSKVALWNSKDQAYACTGQIAWILNGGFVVTTPESGIWIDNDQGVDLDLGTRVTVFGRRNPETQQFYLDVLREDGKAGFVSPDLTEISDLLTAKHKFELTRVRVRGEFVFGEWLEPDLYSIRARSGENRFEFWVRAKPSDIESLDLMTAGTLSFNGVVAFYPESESHDFRMFGASIDDISVASRKVVWSSKTVGWMALAGIAIFGCLLGWSSRLRTRVTEGESNIRRITAELNHACDSVREGMVVFGTDDRVQFANRQASATLGLPVKIGMTSGELLNGLKESYMSVDSAFEVCWQTLNSNDQITRELQLELTGADQSLRLLEVFTSPITNDGGDYINRLWTFHDVTEKEQLHQSLAHLQKQEAVGQLASGFAHDFNNLLQGIIGHLSVMELDQHRPVSDVQDCLEAAIGASERASSLVERILSFSRKSRLQFESCDVNQILVRMDRLLQPSIAPSIEVEYLLDGELPLVNADSTQIEQVLLNLCLNARDALTGGGRILVRTSANADNCIVSISDNGKGIPQDAQQRIFEPFFTTKPGEGSGLGLSMCEGIIHQHGGRIEFESTEGVGTEFRVYLPLAAVPSIAEDDEPRGDVELAGKVALVVDDEEIVRNSVAAMLRYFGTTVLTAENGAQGMNVLAERDHADPSKSLPVDFVLLDWTMPVMDGKEMLREIKTHYPDLPTVVCSGYVFDCESISKETGIRPEAVVQKPYRPEKMYQVVSDVLARSQRSIRERMPR